MEILVVAIKRRLIALNESNKLSHRPADLPREAGKEILRCAFLRSEQASKPQKLPLPIFDWVRLWSI